MAIFRGLLVFQLAKLSRRKDFCQRPAAVAPSSSPDTSLRTHTHTYTARARAYYHLIIKILPLADVCFFPRNVRTESRANTSPTRSSRSREPHYPS